jgi:hypothetical protein
VIKAGTAFEVARPYISDRENIGQLQSMFSDAEYIKKFNSEMTVN